MTPPSSALHSMLRNGRRRGTVKGPLYPPPPSAPPQFAGAPAPAACQSPRRYCYPSGSITGSRPMTAPTLSHRALNRIEAIGNRLPHRHLLFVWLCGIVLALSAIAALLGAEARHPASGEQTRALSLLSGEGLRLPLERTGSNFTPFAPLGTVLAAVLGIGVAEHSGLIGTLLRASVLKAPDRLLTFLVVFAGVLSSIAADSGYVVLIALAGIILQAAGRSPIAGIAAAFAGVSGGFSANLLIGPLDAILAGLSTEAAALVDSTRTVSPAANYYFMVASTLLVAVVGTLVTE